MVANPAVIEQVVSPNIPPPNLVSVAQGMGVVGSCSPPFMQPLKMVEFVAFVDKSKAESDSDTSHEFVNIGPSTSFVDPNMEVS